MSIKVSIIIPVYNSEKYLEKCLRSCADQTIKDIEIIAIDDGSIDSSPKILKEYSLKHKNFKIITQKNQGPSIARQTGIKKASGEFISFVDSDDFIANNFCEVMYNFATQNHCEIVLGLYKGYKNNKLCPNHIPQFMTKEKDIFIAEQNKDIVNHSCITNTIIRKDLLNNIIFPHSKLGEDYAIFSQCAMQAKRVGYTKDTYYAVVYKRSSLCVDHFNEYSLYFFQNLLAIETFLSKNPTLAKVFKDNFEAKRLRFLLRMLGTIKKEPYKRIFFDEFRKQLKNFDKKYIEKLSFRKKYLLWLIEKGYYNTYKILADFYKPVKDVINKIKSKVKQI